MRTNKSLKKIYNDIYKAGIENFFSFSSYTESKLILDFYDDWEEKDVLEIGCGGGVLAAIIGCAGAKKVDAIDYCETAINIAKKQFNLNNVFYYTKDVSDVNNKYDVVIMQGVLEHMDEPFKLLHHLLKNTVKDKGCLITSSPSFLNPRGYVWMTLQLLFDVPMSLSDIHFLSPIEFSNFIKNYDYKMEIKSTDQDWGAGERTIIDFKKRLPNALKDANMDSTKVIDLLQWLEKATPYFQHDDNSGATIAYKIKK